MIPLVILVYKSSILMVPILMLLIPEYQPLKSMHFIHNNSPILSQFLIYNPAILLFAVNLPINKSHISILPILIPHTILTLPSPRQPSSLPFP